MSTNCQNQPSKLRDTAGVYITALASLLIAIAKRVAVYRERSVSRQFLATMSDKTLDDIGLSRWDAMQESSKPFWKS
ncbi:MAG: DUF1127 domain-containing protein [Alphaproteobacteria bacterium]|nr:DUF1127 domain-containing protein [Alphaproteobacteria bacterium]